VAHHGSVDMRDRLFYTMFDLVYVARLNLLIDNSNRNIVRIHQGVLDLVMVVDEFLGLPVAVDRIHGQVGPADDPHRAPNSRVVHPLVLTQKS